MELQLILNKIFEVRGLRVMLDFDLVEMYEVKTKLQKQAVKRNINRFPPDFMFELTKREWNELTTICDQFPKSLKHSYINPTAFTEQEVAMLSSVLRSEKAIEVNIQIIRVFGTKKIIFVRYSPWITQPETLITKAILYILLPNT